MDLGYILAVLALILAVTISTSYKSLPYPANYGAFALDSLTFKQILQQYVMRFTELIYQIIMW
jgi:hypothetical protein